MHVQPKLVSNDIFVDPAFYMINICREKKVNLSVVLSTPSETFQNVFNLIPEGCLYEWRALYCTVLAFLVECPITMSHIESKDLVTNFMQSELLIFSTWLYFLACRTVNWMLHCEKRKKKQWKLTTFGLALNIFVLQNKSISNISNMKRR